MPWCIDMTLDLCYFIEPEIEIIDLTKIKEKRRSTRKRKKTDRFNYDERILTKKKLRRSTRKRKKPDFFNYDERVK